MVRPASGEKNLKGGKRGKMIEMHNISSCLISSVGPKATLHTPKGKIKVCVTFLKPLVLMLPMS